MRKQTITAVIATKNEEKNIKHCLQTLNFVDEIIIVDMCSRDNTVKIAKKFTDKIFFSDGGPYGYIPYNKNIGLKKAKSDWVFFIDADERVSKKLRSEITSTIKKATAYSAFKVAIPTYFWGRWMFYGWDLHQTRLVKRNKTKGYPNIAHGLLNIDGTIGTLNGYLYHFGHLTIEQFINKMNRYTTSDSASLFEKGVNSVTFFTILKIPITNFYYHFFKLKGYKNGMHGFIVCLMLSVYYLIDRLKLWELQFKKNHDEIHKFDHDF